MTVTSPSGNLVWLSASEELLTHDSTLQLCEGYKEWEGGEAAGGRSVVLKVLVMRRSAVSDHFVRPSTRIRSVNSDRG